MAVRGRTKEHDDLQQDVVIDRVRLGKLREEVEEVVALRERLKVELRDGEVGERAEDLHKEVGADARRAQQHDAALHVR